MSEPEFTTTLFTVPFSNFTVSSTLGPSYYDLWSLKGTTSGRVEIHQVNIGQLSTNVTGNQQLSVQIFTGSTALGGGTGVTPVNLKRWATSPTANSSVAAPSSNLGSTVSATLVIADNTDWSGNWLYTPDTYEELTLDTGQGFMVRVSAPPTAVQLSGTLLFKEITKTK